METIFHYISQKSPEAFCRKVEYCAGLILICFGVFKSKSKDTP